MFRPGRWASWEVVLHMALQQDMNGGKVDLPGKQAASPE
jgi:hypothetical protein